MPPPSPSVRARGKSETASENVRGRNPYRAGRAASRAGEQQQASQPGVQATRSPYARPSQHILGKYTVYSSTAQDMSDTSSPRTHRQSRRPAPQKTRSHQTNPPPRPGPAGRRRQGGKRRRPPRVLRGNDSGWGSWRCVGSAKNRPSRARGTTIQCFQSEVARG
jgi:hypothetical protein